MNKIEIDGNEVQIAITGWDKLFSLKGKLTFPLDSVVAVSPYDDSIVPPGIMAPGTSIPKVVIAGTYINLKGRREFWCTHFKGNAIVIDLEHENYDRIVCDLPEDETVDEWKAKLVSKDP